MSDRSGFPGHFFGAQAEENFRDGYYLPVDSKVVLVHVCYGCLIGDYYKLSTKGLHRSLQYPPDPSLVGAVGKSLDLQLYR